MKHYCIDFEEGCRAYKCLKVCDKCKGWKSKEEINAKRKKKNKVDECKESRN